MTVEETLICQHVCGVAVYRYRGQQLRDAFLHDRPTVSMKAHQARRLDAAAGPSVPRETQPIERLLLHEVHVAAVPPADDEPTVMRSSRLCDAVPVVLVGRMQTEEVGGGGGVQARKRVPYSVCLPSKAPFMSLNVRKLA